MQGNNQKAPVIPSLCVVCQRFCGAPETKGMCSVCYKSHLAKFLGNEPKVEKAVTEPKPEDKKEEIHETKVSKESKQEDKTRCWACKARVGYLGFTCKCGYTYCAKHRHYDTHGCTYDYKAEAKAKMVKANPTVEAEKLQKL